MAAAFSFMALGGCGSIPDVEIEITGDAVTSEDGDQVDVSIALERPPLGTVTIRALSSDETEGRTSEAIQFNHANWREPQVITVTGVDDTEADGDVAYDVRVEVSSSRRGERDPVTVDVIRFVNRDDDVALFEGLGDLPGGETSSFAAGVSASGDVIVGASSGEQGSQAVRWTVEAKLQPLAGSLSSASAISPNGKLVVGSAPLVLPGITETVGVISRDGAAFEPVAPPSWPDALEPFSSFPSAVLDDGSVYGACKSQLGSLVSTQGCRVDAAGEVTLLIPWLSTVPSSATIFAASPSGSYAGAHFSHRYASNLFGSFAIVEGEEIGSPFGEGCATRPNRCYSEARALSSDGAIAVGTAMSAPGTELAQIAGFIFDASGLRALSDLPGGDEASGAYAISADGGVIGGFGTDAQGRRATIWRNEVPAALETLLLDAGGSLPAGWRLDTVVAMSADGLTLVGNGTNPDGNPEGFRIELPTSVR